MNGTIIDQYPFTLIEIKFSMITKAQKIPMKLWMPHGKFFSVIYGCPNWVYYKGKFFSVVYGCPNWVYYKGKFFSVGQQMFRTFSIKIAFFVETTSGKTTIQLLLLVLLSIEQFKVLVATSGKIIALLLSLLVLLSIE